VKPIQIQCPHCRETSDLQLELEARMIVMNCPACNGAMMYYYGKTFAIDAGEMEKIRDSRHMTTVQGVVRGPGGREAGPHTAVVRHADSHPAHQAGAPVRQTPFAQDDITNLKIELALAKDVNDFIEGM
jgi:hypothetical protein